MPDILSSLRWQDIVDILIVSYIFYRLILLIRGTRAVQMLAGIIVISIIYFISSQLDLLALHWLLRTFLSSILLIVIIVFQRDIRRALTQMGKTPFQKNQDMAERDLGEIISAAVYMARRRIGALIIIERENGLRDYIDSGFLIDLFPNVTHARWRSHHSKRPDSLGRLPASSIKKSKNRQTIWYQTPRSVRII